MNLKVVKNLSFALFFLYFFLVSIKLLEKGIKTLGAEYTDQLFESVSNPFAGLLVGILCTVLVQSSSVTTSTIVGLVGSGVLSLEYAIPMVTGCQHRNNCDKYACIFRSRTKRNKNLRERLLLQLCMTFST